MVTAELSTSLPVIQTGSVYPPALAEPASREYVKPRLPSQPQVPQGIASVRAQNYSGVSVDTAPNTGQRVASSAGSSSGDGRQYPEASFRVDVPSDGGSLGLPVSGQRRSASTDSRGDNGPAGSAGGTTASSSQSPLSPGGVPPAYSYRPY